MCTYATKPSLWRLRMGRPKLDLPKVKLGSLGANNESLPLGGEPSFYSEYDISDKIGSGTTAVVRRARRLSDGKEVALKCIKAFDEELLQFARDEYHLLRSLRHPGIVQAEMLHVASGQVCVVLEYCERRCLQSYVEEHGCMAEKSFVPLLYQLLQAVDYLHAKRIVHRDFKPDNLLLSGSVAWDDENQDVPSRIKITDFNSAKRIGDQQGASAMLSFRGTQIFSAPELLLGTAWNERVDIWACGLCLFFALRAELPFNIGRKNTKAILMAGSLPEICWQDMSLLAQHITLQCLSVDMRDRPPAMELLHHSLFHEHGDTSQTAISCPSKWAVDRARVSTWQLSAGDSAEVSVPSHTAEQLRQLQKKKLTRSGLPPTAVPPTAVFDAESELLPIPAATADSTFFTWAFPSRDHSTASQNGYSVTAGGEHPSSALSADSAWSADNSQADATAPQGP